MAKLFENQARQYADSRPTYPSQLFRFVASSTPSHHLAWDVGTGNGQAAQSLAEIYQNVIGTDTSEKQLEFAVKLPNVRYKHTPSTLSMMELEQTVAPAGTVDVLTVAQALHWFDLPIFYRQVKWLLKKSHGVIAAWGYNVPRVTDDVDKVFDELYEVKLRPYWDPRLAMWEDNYRNIDFPFEPVAGADDTGPIEYVMEKEMDLGAYLRYVTSVSPYQTAKEKGAGVPWEDYIERLKSAWIEDGSHTKVARNSSRGLDRGKQPEA
ncbi:uncharacterized protein LOC129307340 isoform X2 [Prosopis cineraria]|uniref:uncharacterized protein LOC129307340 isoform X2 n=1 Tax=Prosopis cineraria TaxID=364024 RepID=UPI00240F358E|nr:uncharacterized protein LOC129307340 isoform X2 [Prosopis cineraria]